MATAQTHRLNNEIKRIGTNRFLLAIYSHGCDCILVHRIATTTTTPTNHRVRLMDEPRLQCDDTPQPASQPANRYEAKETDECRHRF